MLKLVLVAMFAFWASFVAGTCVPRVTPDPAVQKAAQTEIGLFRSFLQQPLCEQVAVKYQPAGDYAIIGDFDKAIASLEYRTRFTPLPTTGAIVGDTFYYITNSQLDHDQDGKLLRPDELVAITVAKVSLVQPSDQ
jgi:hypothetical protein